MQAAEELLEHGVGGESRPLLGLGLGGFFDSFLLVAYFVKISEKVGIEVGHVFWVTLHQFFPLLLSQADEVFHAVELLADDFTHALGNVLPSIALMSLAPLPHVIPNGVVALLAVVEARLGHGFQSLLFGFEELLYVLRLACDLLPVTHGDILLLFINEFVVDGR